MEDEGGRPGLAAGFSTNTTKMTASTGTTSGKGKKHNFTGKQVEILELIPCHTTLTTITEKTGRDKSNTLRTLQTLVKRGCVNKRKKQYYLTDYGQEVIDQKSCASIDTTNEGTTFRHNKKLRLHDLWFNIRFWQHPPNWDEKRQTFFTFEGVSDFLYNDKFRGGGQASFKVGEYHIFCYAHSISVHVPEVVHHVPAVATRMAWQKLLDFLPKLENLLDLPYESLYRDKRLNIKLIGSHYAWMNDVFAKWVNPKTQKRFAVFVDGRMRVMVDASFYEELECITPDHGEGDAVALDEYMGDILEGRALMPSAVKNSLAGVTNTMNEMQPVLAEFAEQMQAHVGTAVAINNASGAINNAAQQLADALLELKRLNTNKLTVQTDWKENKN